MRQCNLWTHIIEMLSGQMNGVEWSGELSSETLGSYANCILSWSREMVITAGDDCKKTKNKKIVNET